MHRRYQSHRRQLDTRCPINWQHESNAGLAAWWRSVSGRNGPTWYDLAGTSNGTLTSMLNSTNGFQGQVAPGGDGPSLLFDGSAGYVNVGNTPAVGVTTRFTFAARVMRNYNTAADRWFFGKDDNALGRSYDFGTTSQSGNTKLTVQLNGTNYPATGSTFSIATSGIWYDCVVTYDGTNVQYYLNGLADSSGPYAAINAPTSTASLRLGARSYSGFNNFWQGWLEDIRIWSRCLSRAEVLFLYESAPWGFPGVLNRRPTTAVFVQQPPATAITLTAPSPASGYAGAPSSNWTVGANGSLSGSITVTPSDGGAGGAFSPTSVSISAGAPSATFTYTPGITRNTPVTITVTNTGGLTNPSGILYTVNLPTISISPAATPPSQTGLAVVVTGTGSKWLTNHPAFTIGGLAGAQIVSQVVNNNTTATLTINLGIASGTAIITETLQSETANLSVGVVPTFTTGAVFGAQYGSLVGTVGYTVQKISNGVLSTAQARTISGVSESAAGSGIYVAQFTLTPPSDPDRFIVLWDTGGVSPVYAEDFAPLGPPLLAPTTAQIVSAMNLPANFSILSIDSNGGMDVGAVNGHAVTGTGQKGSEWGPA